MRRTSQNESGYIPSLGERLWAAWSKPSGHRPVSLYLLAASVIVLILGLHIVNVRDDPKRLALILTCFFIFFVAVLCRAIYDGAEIVRGYFRERERLFQETLGDKAFMEQLKRGIEEKRDHAP